ncbi:MAG: ATP-binding protein [Cohaesibacter sp.]|nr:ATP-binding protein [Cohaesibacter sp.]
MHSLHDNSTLEDLSDLSPERMAHRLRRERLARQEAEKLLEEKSQELFEANQTLKLTASSLENQRLQLNTILDNTLAGICLTQTDMTVIRANPAAMDMFGKLDQTFDVTELFANWDEASRFVMMAAEPELETSRTLFEAIGKRSDGSEFPIEFGITCLDHLGWDRAVWIFNDITQRKHEEAKRVALERELNQTHKMEALGTLASGVAHEINTPIQYISDNMRFLDETIGDLQALIEAFQTSFATLEQLGFDPTQLAKAQKLAEEKAKEIDLDYLLEEAPQAIDQSLQGAKQVATIVNAIKEFSHPGEDEKVDLDVNKMIETTLAVTRNQWKYVADMDLDLAPDLPTIMAMPSEISQVILNLIVNAADAIHSADLPERGQIAIASRALDSSIEICIRDNGPGVSKDLQERIFDPFFTTKDIGKGSGQGLAIAYAIIHQKHGGTLRYIGQEGQGAHFVITLPISDETGGH